MIGFFDSGIGGLTILEAVRNRLPTYDMVYLGDTAHAPYGNKSHDELVSLTWQGVEWLFSQGCELVIIACNTASASALREIQQTKLLAYQGKRILGVIRPTVEFLAAEHFRNIVVLSTRATKESGAYEREFEKMNPAIRVYSHAAPLFVPMIEAGKAGSEEMRREVEREVREMEKGVENYDAVLLACTHYPYVKSDIEASLAFKVSVFSQGEIVAASLEDYLARHSELEEKLAKNGKAQFFVTGSAKVAQETSWRFFGKHIHFSALA